MMPIPISARAILRTSNPALRFSGTLGEQILRYLSLDRNQRRHSTITVVSVVELPGWHGPRTFLDTEAIGELAREMTARGLI